MSSIIQAIAAVLVAAVKLIANFFAGLGQMFFMLPDALTLLSYSISMLPPVLVVMATAFISVSVVYLIIGR